MREFLFDLYSGECQNKFSGKMPPNLLSTTMAIREYCSNAGEKKGDEEPVCAKFRVIRENLLQSIQFSVRSHSLKINLNVI